MLQRKKRNSSRVNLIISVTFHSVLVLVVFFFAAREGMLGNKLKQITVTMVPKEKKPEPVKEKPPEPRLEVPKAAPVPQPVAAPPKVETAAAPPPSAEPAVAPAAVSVPSFQFSDGAHDVESSADPNEIYKGLVERALRSRWERPDDVADDKFIAEVQLNIGKEGEIASYQWVKGSGNSRWDESVKLALSKTKAISRPPPKGFPDKFLVRFDVATEATEETVHLSSR